MKFAHLIRITVFSKDEDNVLNSLLSFFPFNLEKEKIKIEKTIADGFENKKIGVYKVTLTKEKHTNQFINSLIKRLDDEQKALISKQLESRLDNELNLFLRFDKDELIKENKLKLTDKGNCFHIKMSIAAFPAKREIALDIVRELFKTKPKSF